MSKYLYELYLTVLKYKYTYEHCRRIEMLWYVCALKNDILNTG